jgi:hypothetical protein
MNSREIIEDMFSVGRMDAARAAVDAACLAIPAVARLKTTPQTPPEHAEEHFVTDHIVRIFAGIDAVEHGTSFAQCEDIGTDPVVRLALIDAERAIRVAPNVFRAFALMHNIAKPDRLLLVAEPGTAGEKEGFVRSAKRSAPYSTKTELVRFDKLRRAGLANGIIATFDDVDRAVIAPQYAEAREAIVKHCGLENAFVKFVAELCWSHEDVKRFFDEPGNASAFATFPARAGKAGINVEKYLDALLAIALIDHDLGRIAPPSSLPLKTLHELALAEYAVMSERHAAREARLRHNQKLRVKAILSESGLDPEELFKQLGIGLGPERGEVMHRVYAVIRGEADASSFGEHAASIGARSRRAAELLAKERLSV